MCADAPAPVEPADHNLRIVRNLYDLLTAGDFEAFLLALPINISLAVPGTSQIAGQYEGDDEVAEWLRRRIELSGGTLRFEPPQSLAADPGHVFALVTEFAQRGDRFLNINNVHLWYVRHDPEIGLGLYWITYPGEQHAWDEFWS